MNEFSKKCEEIASAGFDAGRYRVYPDHQLDFFLAYSPAGRKELIVEAHTTSQKPVELPSFLNFELVVTEISAGIRITITLIDESLSHSFSTMCYDLAERSSDAGSADRSFFIFMAALSHWAELFRVKSRTGLTRQEAIGLYGELLVIKRLIENSWIDSDAIVQAWRGPHGDARDIGFNGHRIEVKTQLATKAKSIKITSLDQLDDSDGSLFLVLNRITSSDGGESLNDLVAELVGMLRASSYGIAEFYRKLELAMYDASSAHASELFVLDEMIAYQVIDDFPRLTPLTVPVGISAVKYEIQGSSVERFIIDWDELTETIDV